MASKSIVEKIYNHPDREEIISKLLMDEDPKTIAEWLNAKYEDVESRQFQLPVRVIADFKKNNLDFYTIMKNDLAIVKQNKLDPQLAITAEIQGTSAYKQALENYANSEVDVRKMISGVCAAAQLRTEQVFNDLQLDPSNFKFDRVLIEWFTVLKDIIKDLNDITNPVDNIQIGTVNQINVQVMDAHINTIYDIIREILSDLDYDTSIKFIEIFNERMTALKASENVSVIPVEHRLAEATNLAEKATIILNKP
jgi:hypothetical protein